MARVLIAGCGYVGEAAANRFHESGWEVEGWTASADSAARLSERPYPVRGVDVTTTNISGDFDVVIHCVSSRGGDKAAYRRLYFEGAKNLLRLFPATVLLFTSSTSVYAQTDGSVVDETSPAEPRHRKGQILRETEEVVLTAGGIVARLAGIHGPNRSFFLTRFLEGATIAGPNDRFVNQVHRDDIADALVLLAERRRECRGQIFNVNGDRPIRVIDAYQWLATRLTPEEAFPSATLERGSPAGTGKPAPARTGKRGESDKQVNNGKLRALGWSPRYPTFERAMSESILASFDL
jgi:nucleoside-diphosphate-sugar epimerase